MIMRQCGSASGGAASPRQQILQRLFPAPEQSAPKARIALSAADLFYMNGVRAVGVDRIVETAKVAKATLYGHFPTKNELVLAYLRYWNDAWVSWFADSTEAKSQVTPNKLMAVFDVLHDLFADGEYRGCAFTAAIADVGSELAAVHDVASGHKEAVRSYLRGLAEEAGARRPAELADELLILVDGAMTVAAREKSPRAAETAKAMAAVLLASDMDAR